MLTELALALALALTPAIPAEAAACPIERATYRLRGEPGITAGFARQGYRYNFTSELAWWVQAGGDRRWFSFWSPNGYGGTFIAPDIDPATVREPTDEELAARDAEREAENAQVAAGEAPIPPKEEAEMDWDAFDADYNVLDVPQLGDRAPAHLFSSELGAHLHYGWLNGDEGRRVAQISMATAMFDLAQCAPAR